MENIDIVYSSDGEYPLSCSLSEVLQNFREAGVPIDTCDAIREAVRAEDEYTGTHEHGRFRIARA